MRQHGTDTKQAKRARDEHEHEGKGRVEVNTSKQRAHGLRLLIKGKGGAGARPGGVLTALVARVIAWADGRRLGLGAETSVTARGLGLSSWAVGRTRNDRKIKGNNLLLSSEPAKVGGCIYGIWDNGDTRGTRAQSKLRKQNEEEQRV